MLRKLTVIALFASSFAIASEDKITVSSSAKILDTAETINIKPKLEFLAAAGIKTAVTATTLTGTWLVPTAALSVSSEAISTPILAALVTPAAPFVVGGCIVYVAYNKVFPSKKA